MIGLTLLGYGYVSFLYCVMFYYVLCTCFINQVLRFLSLVFVFQPKPYVSPDELCYSETEVVLNKSDWEKLFCDRVNRLRYSLTVEQVLWLVIDRTFVDRHHLEKVFEHVL